MIQIAMQVSFENEAEMGAGLGIFATSKAHSHVEKFATGCDRSRVRTG